MAKLLGVGVAVALEIVIFGGMTVLGYRWLRRRSPRGIVLPGIVMSLGLLLLILSLLITVVAAGVGETTLVMGVCAISGGVNWWIKRKYGRSRKPEVTPIPMASAPKAEHEAGWAAPSAS